MTSREIVIKLINEDKIDGEEAFELMNSIIIAEMEQAKEVLNKCGNTRSTDWNHFGTVDTISYPTNVSTISTDSTWTTGSYDITALNEQYIISNAINTASK